MLEGLSSDILDRPLSLASDDTDGDVLAHFGIKGQKWGVRRYQNSDGSLTEEGKKRYNSNGDYNSYRGGTGKITKDFPNDPAKQASVLKQIADSRKKDAYDRLEKASKSGDLNEDISDLIKSGTVKNKADALQYTVDAAKKYNEEIDDDGSMFQSLGHELYLYQKGYLDKGTFDKLYDAEAARSVADYGRNMYTDPIYAESVKDMHNYKSKLNNRLSWWFGDNSSNPEYNPNKPISYTEGSAEKEDYYASHSDSYSDSLSHFGIKGQKWGVRRYQNADGTLTDAGKKHYSKGIAGAIKRKKENTLLNNAIAKSRAKKASDKAMDEWLDDDKKAEKASNKYSKLADAEERAISKAEAYSRSKNRDSKKEEELWGEAAKKGDEAERYYDEVVSKADSKRDSSWKKVEDLDQQLKSLDADQKKRANKYIKKYGQEEFDKIPKTDHEVTKLAIDDMIEVMSGNMTKKQFNKKFDGTGFIVHSDFLAHHGVKGQKWGNRRYQNSDGSLTPLGRVRYGVGAARKAAGKAAIAGGKAAGKALRKAVGMQTDAELDEELAKAQKKYDRAAKKRAIAELSGKRTPLSKMTDAEIDQYLNRLNKTKQINALEKDIKDQGRGFVSKFAHNAMNNAADNLASGIGEGIKRGVSQKISDSLTKSEDKLKKAADDARNKKNAYQDELEFRALMGDKEATKNLRKVANAKKGKKNGDGQGGSDKPNDSNDSGNKKKNERNKTREAWRKTNLMDALRDFDNDPEGYVNGRTKNKKQKVKENLKKQTSTPVSEVKNYSVSKDTIDWMARVSSRKALPPAESSSRKALPPAKS